LRKWVRRILLALLAWRLGPPYRPRFRPPQEHPWRLEGRTVFVGDQEFLVREAGPADAPPVVLIHGLGGSSLGEWYRVGPRLSERRRVILVDHRSHGLSPLATDRYEVEDVADEIAAILDRLGVGSADVVGYSMGGAIAQALAARHPGLVRRLVLIATFAAFPHRRRRLLSVGALLTRAWERLTGLGTPEVRTGYLLRVGAVEPRHARWLWQETHRRNPDAGYEATMATVRFDSLDWVGRLDLPTLVVVPTRDMLVPAEWQLELASRIPGAKTVQVEGAHHEVVWTHPDLILSELDSFLA
jgi:3-oxoadipate enol-lactonase